MGTSGSWCAAGASIHAVFAYARCDDGAGMPDDRSLRRGRAQAAIVAEWPTSGRVVALRPCR